jgi:hypothetical protein
MRTLVTGEELADLVGLSAVTIRRYARDGLIPAMVSPGGHRKYEVEAALNALDLLRSRISAQSEPSYADDEVRDIPPTPRGAFVHSPVRVTVRAAAPSAPVLSVAEWNELVEVLDAGV